MMPLNALRLRSLLRALPILVVAGTFFAVSAASPTAALAQAQEEANEEAAESGSGAETPAADAAETPPEGDAEVEPESEAESEPEPEPEPEPDPEPEPEPRLRFAFRFQRWIDVLEWLADQADLSLVVQRPPPGTFNYTDTREFTPDEAIEIINQALLMQGFALIRRDRMLTVVDLAEDLPGAVAGMIPRATVDDLADYRDFDLVTVRIPIGRRDPKIVEAEVRSLLNPHGRFVALPATQQVEVTDAAGLLRHVARTVQQIREPPRPIPSPSRAPRASRRFRNWPSTRSARSTPTPPRRCSRLCSPAYV